MLVFTIKMLTNVYNLQTEKDQLSGVRSKEKLKSSAESQVTFNEAIRKVIDEKDKKIESLESSLNQTRNGNQSLVKDLEDQLAKVKISNLVN